MVRLIALNGKMGVGKTEAVKLIGSLSDRPVITVKFAQPLYDMQELIYGRIESAYKRPESFIKDRKLLQWLGTNWGRETISQSIWVDLWTSDVQEYLDYGCLVLCDDVRFDNEAEAVKRMGGKIIKITSERNHERIDTMTGIANHASEAGIKQEYVDYLIENNGSLEAYKNSLVYVCEQLGISDNTPTESA